jgi:hypothetical protein
MAPGQWQRPEAQVGTRLRAAPQRLADEQIREEADRPRQEQAEGDPRQIATNVLTPDAIEIAQPPPFTMQQPAQQTQRHDVGDREPAQPRLATRRSHRPG